MTIRYLIILLSLNFLNTSFINAQCKSVRIAKIQLSNEKATEALETLKGIDEGIVKQEDVKPKCLANYYFSFATAYLQQAISSDDYAQKNKSIQNSWDYFQKLFKYADAPDGILNEGNQQFEQLGAVALNTAAEAYGKKEFSDALMLSEKSIEIYDKIDNEDNKLSAIYNATLSAIESGEQKLAVDWLDVLIEKDFQNNNPMHYRLKAEALVRLKKIDEANATLSDASKIYPNDLDLKFQQLNLLLEESKNEQALELVNKILDKVDNRADLFIIQAQLLHSKEEYLAAKEAYTKAYEIDSKSEYALNGIASYYITEANTLVDMLNAGKDEDGNQVNKSELEEQIKNNYNKAIQYLEQILILDANNQNAIRTLSNIYDAIGNKSKSEEFKQKLKN